MLQTHKQRKLINQTVNKMILSPSIYLHAGLFRKRTGKFKRFEKMFVHWVKYEIPQWL